MYFSKIIEPPSFNNYWHPIEKYHFISYFGPLIKIKYFKENKGIKFKGCIDCNLKSKEKFCSKCGNKIETVTKGKVEKITDLKDLIESMPFTNIKYKYLIPYYKPLNEDNSQDLEMDELTFSDHIRKMKGKNWDESLDLFKKQYQEKIRELEKYLEFDVETLFVCSIIDGNIH